MTSPAIDLSNITPAPMEGIPNWKASSGESGNGVPTKDFGEEPKSRPGIFGGTVGRGKTRAPKMSAPVKAAREPTPKLAPGMKGKITEFYLLIGGAIRPFDEPLGDTIIEQAPLCGKAVYDYAQENEAFRRALQGFMTASVGGALIFAHLPIVLIALRHSKNDKVKFTAASTAVALKMMTKEQAADAFPEKDEDADDGEQGIR